MADLPDRALRVMNLQIDLWSLGCVVAELFTSNVLFSNDSVPMMLARISSVRGNFPEHMLARGTETEKFFTNVGLIYEEVDDDEAAEDAGVLNINIHTPIPTTLQCALGIDGSDLSPMEERFVDFVGSLLQIDPKYRLTAAEALRHPFIEETSKEFDDDCSEIMYREELGQGGKLSGNDSDEGDDDDDDDEEDDDDTDYDDNDDDDDGDDNDNDNDNDDHYDNDNDNDNDQHESQINNEIENDEGGNADDADDDANAADEYEISQ